MTDLSRQAVAAQIAAGILEDLAEFDQVSVVVKGDDLTVFGHHRDALDYAARIGGQAIIVRANVLDHADARRLIEREGEA